MVTHDLLTAANIDGKLHVLTYSGLIGPTTYLILRLKTSSKYINFFLRFFIERRTELIFHRVLSFVEPGTEIQPINTNRNFVNAPHYQAYVDPVLTGAYEELIIPSNGTDTGRGLHFPEHQVISCGGFGFILRPDSEYFISLRNLNTINFATLGIVLTTFEI